MVNFKKILIISGLFLATSSFPWGFHAHKIIARNSAFILPQEMLIFYKPNLHQIAEASIQPDIRRYVYDDEGPKHYIDLELYGSMKDSVLYMNWLEVVERFGEDSLLSKGILPWAIVETYYYLTNAFREKNGRRIIQYSADLCHYVADAHDPLHTTYNYDGQYTGQEGIHRLWESLVPEKNSNSYSYWVGKAEYKNNIYQTVRGIIMDTHTRIDSVLSIEKELSETMGSDQKFSFRQRGNREIKEHSDSFIQNYEKKMNGMVERQIRASIKMTGSLWYSSWIEAGQPDLSTLRISGQSKDPIINDDHEKADSLSRTRLHQN